MSYIGSTPANKLVTSSDMEDGIVTTAKIANDAATADKIANAVNSAITANTAKTGISSAQTSAITANTSKTTNATHSGEVTGSGALTIAGNVVDEANLKVSNSPTNGYFLAAQSGNTGGLTWQEAGGEDNAPYFRARMGGTNTLSDSTATKVQYDTSVFNVGGTYDTSNYRWTPGTAGRYYIEGQVYIQWGRSAGKYIDLTIRVSNAETIKTRTRAGGDQSGLSTAQVRGIVTLSSSQYVEIFTYAVMGQNKTYDNSTAFTWFEGFKIANT